MTWKCLTTLQMIFGEERGKTHMQRLWEDHHSKDHDWPAPPFPMPPAPPPGIARGLLAKPPDRPEDSK